jgi:hypothetical protein
MGRFKAMRDLQKQTREVSKVWRPGEQTRGGLARIAAAEEQLAQMTKQVKLRATGSTCGAAVLAARDTGATVNMERVIEVELTILPNALPPYPATIRQAVSQFYIHRIHAGSTLSVKVDANDPSSVYIDVMASFAPRPPGGG